MRWMKILVVILIGAVSATASAQGLGGWSRPSIVDYRVAQNEEVAPSGPVSPQARQPRVSSEPPVIMEQAPDEAWVESSGPISGSYAPRGFGLSRGCGCGYSRPMLSPFRGGCSSCGMSSCGCEPSLWQKLNCSCKTQLFNLQHRCHHWTVGWFGRPCSLCGTSGSGCCGAGGMSETMILPDSHDTLRPAPTPAESPGPAENVVPGAAGNAAYRESEPRPLPYAVPSYSRPSPVPPARVAPAAWQLPVNRRAF